jgi:RimJ/RimL family protein N-acetyltransferase
MTHEDKAMTSLETPRLSMRLMRSDDAEFYLTLQNTEGWRKNIGDRGIRSVEAARQALLDGPLAMQARHGFSLLAVERKGLPGTIGMCGLVKRDMLPEVDIGYGFLPEYWGQGYAFEAASRVLAHARDDLGLKRLMGISARHNAGSIRILEKLGLQLQEVIRTSDSDPGTLLYVRQL